MTKVTIQTQAAKVTMQLFPLSPDAVRALRAPNDTPPIRLVVSDDNEYEGHSRLVRPA
ncbi:hypothetical protein [Yoonia sp. 2307UL14-13]|uniref:hypothetical protein n=1 Tax=Yoonia sp. 2307UL14-13 TaxID=3126506 RepID=UPI00309928D0